MLESQIDQAERRATLRNDLKVQQQQEERRRTFAQDQSVPNPGSTFHAHAIAEAAMPRGRFSAVENATVVGANPVIDYPAGPAWSADPGAQCVEPPLGLDNPALEVASLVSTPQATGDPTDPATPLAVERVGSPLSQSDDPTTEGSAPPSASPRTQPGGVGSSPVPYRRY
jgi:hypothetical protein